MDPFTIGILVSIGVSLLTTGVGLAVQNHYAEKAEKKNDELMAKSERKAKANALKQFNYALAWGQGEGVAMAEKRILDEKRELRAKERNYGEPVV